MTMCLRILLSLLCGSAVAFGQVKEQPPRYIRFPETISPDGEYFFAWGNSLKEGTDTGTLVEAPYPAWLDPTVFEIQDYLVEAKRARPPLALPRFEYFSGSKGHEDKHGLSVAWSPDSKGALAIYESDAGYVAAVWVDPAARRIHDLGRTFEEKLRELAVKRFEDEAEIAASRHVFFGRLAVLSPGVLTLDGSLSRSNLRADKPLMYWFRMRFSLVPEGEKMRAELLTSRVVHPDEVTAEQSENGTLEERLDKALVVWRAQLPLAAREALKKEQALWVKQRESLANAWNRAGFTRHRIMELRIRAAEYEPPKAP